MWGTRVILHSTGDGHLVAVASPRPTGRWWSLRSIDPNDVTMGDDLRLRDGVAPDAERRKPTAWGGAGGDT
jgi:hypothetical protein